MAAFYYSDALKQGGSRIMATETPPDFRDRAAECDRLAATALNPKTRETMLYIASRWRALADENEARASRLRAGSPTRAYG